MGTLFDLGLLFLLIIPAVIGQTDFRCYTCSSDQDKRCGEPFQPLVPTYPCPGSCLKFRGERVSNGVPIVEVNRMCGDRTPEGCQNGVIFNGIATRRCYCNTNMCNRGNQDLVPSLLAMVILLLARWIFT